MACYTGPAGFMLTRDEAFVVWRELVHCNDVAVRDVRQRLRTWLETPWTGTTPVDLDAPCTQARNS